MRQRILAYDSTFGTENDRRDHVAQQRCCDDHPVAAGRADVRRHRRAWCFDCDQHACTGSHQGRYQPGWTGVDVPKTGTTITVNGATTGSHLNITVAPK